jgi:2-polyprenyl-3-methyl-5-hydroxy-6-metoxy-1,4-benzoquinol methylase
MMEIKSNTEWFKTWFNTDYYHILYKNRDDKEAELLIKNLTQKLKILPNNHILDLACGKGRHSYYLSKLGYNVLGADLSENNIEEAKKLKENNLDFLVHDMRKIIPNKKFDFVFNLFTSFGYFENEKENEKVLNAIHTMLKPNGTLIIDFMNVQKVIRNLIEHEEKKLEGIHFQIHRYFNKSHIFKRIQFSDNNQTFDFTEKVQLIDLCNFERLFKLTGFELIETYGDFELNPFDEYSSNRLIMNIKKIND